MAVFSISGGSNNSFSWTISGLQDPYNQTYYTSAGCATSSVPTGGTETRPSMMFNISGQDYTLATASGTSKSTSGFCTNVPAGTYTFYGFARSANGKYYGINSATVTVTGSTPSRPSDFTGFGSIYSGAPITNLTAVEWNNFCSRINEFRRYKGLSNYPFSYATSGSTIYAYQFNEANSAIGSMTSTGVGTKYSGYPIRASDFQTLKSRLNSIS